MGALPTSKAARLPNNGASCVRSVLSFSKRNTPSTTRRAPLGSHAPADHTTGHKRSRRRPHQDADDLRPEDSNSWRQPDASEPHATPPIATTRQPSMRNAIRQISTVDLSPPIASVRSQTHTSSCSEGRSTSSSRAGCGSALSTLASLSHLSLSSLPLLILSRPLHTCVFSQSDTGPKYRASAVPLQATTHPSPAGLHRVERFASNGR
ncbi:hypothetical protein TBK1r_66300 [Stieleria magnilauensis]|uniref:Uncharacterized protein n=1 Tax=Stieleria magnilauensis TaxID=2527963 RepID=A0ABX5XZY3_9BACT|nr:hypothetical protein TBK1r_66300 [Planctomycetes bacterium TBK1r]